MTSEHARKTHKQLLEEVERLERRVRRAEYVAQKYRALFEVGSDAVMTLGFVDGFIAYIDANQGAADLFRCRKEDLNGHTPLDFSPPVQPDGESSREALMRVIASFQTRLHATFEWQHRRLDGTLFDAEVTISTHSDSRRFTFLSGIRDITARKVAERRYTLLAEHVTDIIWSTDTELRLTYINPAVQTLLGYAPEDVIGRNLIATVAKESSDLARAEASAAVARAHQGEGTELHPIELQMRTIDGELVWTEVHANVVFDPSGVFTGLIGTTRDITLRKARDAERALMNERVQANDRLSAIGQLAGGVAHDMNNILAAVMSFASVLANEVDGEQSQQDVAGILRACHRGRELTRNLLGYARGGKYRSERVTLNELIRETQQLLARTIPKGVVLRVELADDLPDVQGDPSQLARVMVNLAVNAVDALEGAGTLVFATREVTLGPEDLGAEQALKPGRYVCLEVIDDGCGMSPEVMGKAFDPFFTTKKPGEGTGLGLSMVYGTISNHGGLVRLASPGEGTTVSIFLPVAPPQVAPRRSPTAEVPRVEHRGTLLLVDDEELLLLAGGRACRKLGYKVHTADGGENALAVYEAQHDQIDLVILDLSMPHMDGIETFRRLRQIDPEVRVLISSGHFREDRAEEIIAEGAAAFLQKPFTAAELSRALSDALEPDDA